MRAQSPPEAPQLSGPGQETQQGPGLGRVEGPGERLGLGEGGQDWQPENTQGLGTSKLYRVSTDPLTELFILATSLTGQCEATKLWLVADRGWW